LNRRSAFLFALAAMLTGSVAGIPYAIAEPGWSVERSEAVSLFYGEPKAPLLTITCGQEDGETGKDETRIEVDTAKGTTGKADKVVLVIETKAGRKEVSLKAAVCGPGNECTNLPDGETYRYETSVPGKRAAVEIADKAERISIDAPGAKFSAPRDAKVFKKFSQMCLNW
jgi:hypothetical protein